MVILNEEEQMDEIHAVKVSSIFSPKSNQVVTIHEHILGQHLENEQTIIDIYSAQNIPKKLKQLKYQIVFEQGRKRNID